MAETAKQIVDGWVSENVIPSNYVQAEDQVIAKALAFQCWQATDKAGFSRAQVDAAVGSLPEYIAAAVVRINDEAVQRLANKP